MKKALIALCVATFSLSANATDKLNYNYFQFGLIHSAGEVTGDKVGYNLEISHSMTDSSYLKFKHNTQSADVWAGGIMSDVDAIELSLSAGYHTAITRSSDFYGEIGFVKQDAQGIIPQATYGNDGDGFLAKLGVRTRWTADWETNIYAGYQDVELASYMDEARHEDGDTSFGVEVRYYLNKTWSLGLSVGEEVTGETSQLTIRADF